MLRQMLARCRKKSNENNDMSQGDLHYQKRACHSDQIERKWCPDKSDNKSYNNSNVLIQSLDNLDLDGVSNNKSKNVTITTTITTTITAAQNSGNQLATSSADDDDNRRSLSLNVTDDQKRLLIKTWKRDDFDWLYQMGMLIYKRIFMIAPCTKALFPYVAEAEKANQDFSLSKKFRGQALRFIQVMGEVIAFLETPSECDILKLLFDVGKKHQKFAKDRGFKAEYWYVFEQAVIKVMSDEMETNCQDSLTSSDITTLLDGWRLVTAFIIEGMRAGFNDHGDDAPKS